MVSRWGYVLILLAPLAAFAPSAAEDYAPLAPQAGVLVLRNGNVLHGQILKAGDAYVLEAEGGGTIRVPATTVDVACRDLAEAYQVKAGRLDHPSAHQRIDLADWCLRMKLPGGAAEQFLLATKLDPTNPRLPVLERKLALLAAPKQEPQEPAAPASVPNFVGPDELERAMESVPSQAVESFTNHVQPLLLNRCATATCHGQAATNDFRLTRPSQGQPLTRRFTQRNLHAVLQQVNRTNPEQSPLLLLPLGPHGTAKAAIWTEREIRLLDEVKRFLIDLAPLAAQAPAEISKPAGALMQPASDRGPDAAIPVILPPNDAGPAAPIAPPGGAAPGVAETPTQPGLLTPDQRHAAKKIAPPLPYTPRDPFDPEIFNRQFHGVK